ncbi:unnamed protein product, partial [marine sediment metagenome]
LWPSTTSALIQKETREFMEFVNNLSGQINEGEELPELDYVKPRIKVRVLLAAKKETKSYGKKPYIRRIREAQQKGIEYLYICGWGIENVEFIKSLAKEQQTNGQLSILHSNEYNRRIKQQDLRAIVVLTAINLNPTSKSIDDPSDLVRIILEENVAEVRNGQIEIVAIGREAGQLTKIAVRSTNQAIDPV